MNPYEKKNRDFHLAMGLAVDVPMSEELLLLRQRLIAEEVRELDVEIAAAVKDLQETGRVQKETYMKMLKEIADIQYVLSGLSVTFGFPIDTVFDRVHESNMSKLGEDGKPVLREDGKVMKGPHYHPPILEDIA